MFMVSCQKYFCQASLKVLLTDFPKILCAFTMIWRSIMESYCIAK